MPDNSQLLLDVDTSSSIVSAAVAVVGDADVQVTVSRDEAGGNRHGELLSALIDEVLRETGATPADLMAVAVGLGPGPFTGLRVGVVTAASLADALAVPSYGVCSLDAIAHGHPGVTDLLVCTDARRKQVYWARYDVTRTRVEGPDIATPHDVAARFAADVDIVVGAGVALYPDEFATFRRTADAAVSATLVAQLAAAKAAAGAPSDVMEPMYLRRPDAAPPGRPKPVLPA